MRSRTFLLLVCSLLGCSGPRQQVVPDALAFVRQHLGPSVQVVVLDYGPGEGDSDDAYYHVRLRLMSQAPHKVESGPFAGLSLQRNVPTQIELEMLYQYAGKEWSLTNVTVHVKGAS
jgi:hypothetical protein